MNPDQQLVRICLASSVGGHLQELLQLRPVYGAYPHFYILNDRINLPEELQGKTYFIRHSERDWLFFWNLWEAFRILRREQPTHLISTGAGLAVPLALVARVFGVQVMFIETFAAFRRPSLTGRLLYRIAHRFVYQWPYLRDYYPSAQYAGTIFDIRFGR
jgi:UDP-N-acetylglucosamine:LPS N-acetylglucosamine transferase